MGLPHQPAPRRSGWDLMLLAAAGLILIGQARLHSFVPALSVLRPAMLMGVVALAVLVIEKDPSRSVRNVFQVPAAKAAFFVLAWAIIGVPFSMSLGGTARFLLDSFSRAFLVFLIIAAAVRNLEDVRRLMGTLAIGVGFFSLLAPVARYSGQSAGGYDPNDSAMFIVSGFPVLLYFVMCGRKVWIRIGAAALALSALAAVFQTQSRGGFIGLVAVVAFMVLGLRAVRPAVRVGVVLVALAVAAPTASSDYWERMETITELDDGYGGGVGGRKNTWRRALGYTGQNPVTGIGAHQFWRAEGSHPEIQARIQAGQGVLFQTAHSMWFLVLAELGIPGFLAFAAIFLLCLRELWRLQTSGSDPPGSTTNVRAGPMAGILMASMIGLMAAGSFLSSSYGTMVWGILGMVVGLVKVTSRGLPGGAGARLTPPRSGGSRFRQGYMP